MHPTECALFVNALATEKRTYMQLVITVLHYFVLAGYWMSASFFYFFCHSHTFTFNVIIAISCIFSILLQHPLLLAKCSRLWISVCFECKIWKLGFRIKYEIQKNVIYTSYVALCTWLFCCFCAFQGSPGGPGGPGRDGTPGTSGRKGQDLIQIVQV